MASQPQGIISNNNSFNSNQQSTLSIQLLYDINQATDQNSWDGNFHPISFHRSMEYLLSDIKNIKIFFNQMTKYIPNKFVERGKVNNFDNLKDISKVAWDFISAIYNSGWNALSADNNISFRTKFASKFTLKTNNNNVSKNNGSKSDDKPATINRLSLHIPAKSPREVKNIAKFLKKMKNQKKKKPQENLMLKHHH